MALRYGEIEKKKNLPRMKTWSLFLRRALQLQNAARMVLNVVENSFDVLFILFTRHVDLIESESGHCYFLSGGEKFLNIY